MFEPPTPPSYLDAKLCNVKQIAANQSFVFFIFLKNLQIFAYCRCAFGSLFGSEHKCTPNNPSRIGWLVDSYELCIMVNDTEIILLALQKERQELHDRIL